MSGPSKIGQFLFVCLFLTHHLFVLLEPKDSSTVQSGGTRRPWKEVYIPTFQLAEEEAYPGVASENCKASHKAEVAVITFLWTRGREAQISTGHRTIKITMEIF